MDPRSAAAETQAAVESAPMGGLKWLAGRIFIPLALLRRKQRETLRMADSLSVVRRVLLVLPLEADARRVLLPQLFAFKAEFPSWRFDLLFLGGEVPTSADGFKGLGVVRGSRWDMTPLGLPGRALRNRLKKVDFGLVIDLSQERHPFVPYLLERAGIPLRMGVNGRGRARYRLYNLLVRLQGDEDLLGRLAQTISPICRTGEA